MRVISSRHNLIGVIVHRSRHVAVLTTSSALRPLLDDPQMLACPVDLKPLPGGSQ